VIARLIHGEVLVGDRQFWITRPYEWAKLLAAKGLFVALFIYLPFLLMGAAILLEAGFNPLSYIPGLLYRLLLISLVFLPLVCLATVTSSLTRLIFTMLGVSVAFGLAFSLILSTAGADGYSEPMTYMRVPNGGIASVAVAILACGAVIVLQYARRRVVVARLLFGCIPFLFLLTSFLCNRSVWMDRAYPPATQTDTSVIRITPLLQDKAATAALRACVNPCRSSVTPGPGQYFNVDRGKWAKVDIMMTASGVAAGGRWQLDAFRPTLTPAHGAPVKLDWQKVGEVVEAPGNSNRLGFFNLEFLLRRADYERLKSSPLTLHLDFALTQAQVGRTWQLPLPEGNFVIPDLASCSTMKDMPGSTLHITGLDCRFPLRMPTPTIITALMTKGPCETPTVTAGDSTPTYYLTTGDFSSAPATFGITPMEEIFSGGPGNSSSNGMPLADSEILRLCPGTPVVVTQYRKVRAVETGVTMENFSLSEQ
jgi:hypothetical protein